MLLKIPQNIIVVLSFVAIVSVLFWFSLIEGTAIQFEGDYSLIHFPPQKNLEWLSITCVFLSMICAYIVFQMNKIHRITVSNSVSFVLFTSIGFTAFLMSNISILDLTAALLTLISLSITLRIHNQNSVLGLLFVSSFLLGVATIFFYPSVLLLLTVLLTVAFFRPFELRNYVVILVGLTLTAFYILCFAFLFNWDLQLIEPDFSKWGSIVLAEAGTITVIIFSLVTLVASFTMFSKRSKFIVRQRNQLVVIFIYILIQITLSLIFCSEALWISLVPLFSLFILHYYKSLRRKWIFDVLLMLFVFLLIWLKL